MPFACSAPRGGASSSLQATDATHWGDEFMAVPPGRFEPQPRQPQLRGKPASPMRHPVWSGSIAIVALLAAVGCASPSGSKSVGAATAGPTPRATVTSAAHATSSLVCHARAVVWRPADHTIAKVEVRTVAGARVSASGPLAWLHSRGAAIRAEADGTRTLRFRVGNATPGSAVVITVQVSSGRDTGSCRARLRPRPAAVTVAAPAPPVTPPPSTPPPAARPPATPPPAPKPTATCYPISDEGTCYEPGEFCRDDDHGMTGLAGDGETIVCEDNDGWRWEPV